MKACCVVGTVVGPEDAVVHPNQAKKLALKSARWGRHPIKQAKYRVVMVVNTKEENKSGRRMRSLCKCVWGRGL